MPVRSVECRHRRPDQYPTGYRQLFVAGHNACLLDLFLYQKIAFKSDFLIKVQPLLKGVLGSERQDAQYSGSLDGSGQFSLVFGAKSCFFGSFDLGGRGQEQFESVHVLEIYFSNVLFAKVANHMVLL